MWFLLPLAALCLIGVLHTYLLYPVLLRHRLRGRGCRRTKELPEENEHSTVVWPTVHLCMSVYNEASVLPRTLDALARMTYVGDIRFYLADDCSSDRTKKILDEYSSLLPGRTSIHRNRTRTGKPETINRLIAHARPSADDVLVFVDASVRILPDTVTELVAPLIDGLEIGVVDAYLQSEPAAAASPRAGFDAGPLEARYLRREAEIKRLEGEVYGYVAGPFGGCWALRARFYCPVPPQFLVDDFYLCAAAYARGARGVFAPRALAFEPVGRSLAEEFRRKRRIGAGNWQNMLSFRRLWWPPWRSPLGYVLFSHKVLRWWTPVLLVIAATTYVYWCLSHTNYLSLLALVGLAGLCTRVRALRYFAAMNVALLWGLRDYLTGISTNVWQPPHRSPTPPSDRAGDDK